MKRDRACKSKSSTLSVDKGIKSLFEAIYARDSGAVSELLSKGVSPNAFKPISYEGALEEACRIGDPKIVYLLLHAGANVMDFNIDGNTPLHLAVHHGHLECVKLLVEYGSDLEALDSSQFTPLMKAADKGHVEIVRYLFNHGAKVFPSYWPRFHSALTVASSKGHAEIVKILCDNTERVGDMEMELYAALLDAVKNGHSEVVDILIKEGANVRAPPNCSISCIGCAAERGQEQIIKLMVQHRKSSVGEIDGEGYTPLMRAAMNGHTNAVATLLELGANPRYMRKVDGETAASLALKYGHQKILNLLSK
ncbi:hypothetical protein Aperf_G00000074880 [Anoplocephala perfoliata]